MGAGQEDDSRVWINGGQVYGKGQRTEEEAIVKGIIGRRKDFRNTKKNGWEKRRYWRVRDSETRLTSQNPHE